MSDVHDGTLAADSPAAGPVMMGKGSDDKFHPIAVNSSGQLVLGASGGAIDTELPAAAALADSTANPTTVVVGSLPYVWTGSVWNRQSARTSNTDGVSVDSTPIAIQTQARAYNYNGTTYDRRRNNTDNTIYASAARTADPTVVDQTNYNGRGLHVVIDVTAVTADPSVVFTIQGKNSLGVVYTILGSVAITGTGTTVLKVYPGLTGAANAVANDVLPRTWNIKAVHADTDSITYSVTASVIL